MKSRYKDGKCPGNPWLQSRKEKGRFATILQQICCKTGGKIREKASKYRIQGENAEVANRYIWLHKYGKSLHLKDKKGVSKK